MIHFVICDQNRSHCLVLDWSDAPVLMAKQSKYSEQVGYTLESRAMIVILW